MNNKKAISSVVSGVLMIAITVSLVAVVWGVVNNLVFEKTEEGMACSDIHGELEIGGGYTCYNSSENTVSFQINRGDIELDEIIVRVQGKGTSKTLNIENGTSISDLEMYSGSSTIELPPKNGGSTYIYDLGAAGLEKPNAISIAPIINDNTCSEIDSVQGIESCSLFIL